MQIGGVEPKGSPALVFSPVQEVKMDEQLERYLEACVGGIAIFVGSALLTRLIFML